MLTGALETIRKINTGTIVVTRAACADTILPSNLSDSHIEYHFGFPHTFHYYGTVNSDMDGSHRYKRALYSYKAAKDRMDQSGRNLSVRNDSLSSL